MTKTSNVQHAPGCESFHPLQVKLRTSPNKAIGNRNGSIDTNAIVTVAEAMPSEISNVGPQHATPVNRAGTAEMTLLAGFRLHTVRALYVYVETEKFAPTRIPTINPKIMFGIARKMLSGPRVSRPIGSQLKGVRTRKIRFGQLSSMESENPQSPEFRTKSPVMTEYTTRYRKAISKATLL